MARGWYQTLSFECPSSIFCWYVLCVIVPFFFLFFFMLSLELYRGSSSYPADYVPDHRQPPTSLGMVETRWVNVKQHNRFSW